MTPEDQVRLNRLYSDALEGVRRVINEWDPEEPLAIGAPDDEYDTAIAVNAHRKREHS